TVVPDAMTVAKGLGGGFPIGALITAEKIGSPLVAGDHGSTFAGGPVVAAAALASLEVVSEPGLLSAVRSEGARFAAALRDLPGVKAVRGRGLMIGADIDGDAPALVMRALAEEALVINATGPHTLRCVPPLVISPTQLDSALTRLARLLAT
ncbi:MAG: aminotransferase class III-fold pyridoxal phosphate-dependent enzyme, partial [Solirubrobacterales bacterium]|nr:aminotransferase class III-fold pyridoxal phosphate-dependent enzyme [Solirubrobacterales bacterium]